MIFSPLVLTVTRAVMSSMYVSVVQLVPGETALAFYTAKNLSDKAITGVATYNVTPVKAGERSGACQCGVDMFQKG